MNLTELLQAARSGDVAARADLVEAAYSELRHIAADKMRAQRQDHTLTATALVHEVSLRMLTDNELPLDDRGRFFAYVAKAMRNYLVDYARRHGSQKRGGGMQRFFLGEATLACRAQRDEFLALHEALERLATITPRKAQVVEMRYFGGFSNAEVAAALEISVATVKREWDTARTWLLHQLTEYDPLEIDDGPIG